MEGASAALAEGAILLGLRWPKGADPATTDPVTIKGGLADVWADKPLLDIDGHDIHAVVLEARKSGSESRPANCMPSSVCSSVGV